MSGAKIVKFYFEDLDNIMVTECPHCRREIGNLYEYKSVAFIENGKEVWDKDYIEFKPKYCPYCSYELVWE